MAKCINDTELAIADRFFYVLDLLKRKRIIGGIYTFTRAHNINQGNMSVIYNHRDKWALKTEYLAFLAQDYGVSCEWLLLGNGDMFMPWSIVLKREREEAEAKARSSASA